MAKSFEEIVPPKMPCPLWLRGDCPCPNNPDRDCPNWKSGECRPGLRGDVQQEIRKGEREFGKVTVVDSDPYISRINYLDNDGALKAEASDGGLLAHPILEKVKSPYFEGVPPPDNGNARNNPKAVEANADRLENRPAMRPSMTPKLERH